MSRGAQLARQTVVVIGGTAGIGLETARLARAEGADIILTARNADRLQTVGLELGASIAAFDATDLDRLAGFFEALRGPVDHVLAAAGGPDVPAELARNAVSKVRAGGTLLFVGCTANTAGLPALTKKLALEIAPIRVNVVAAGFVDAPLSAAVAALAVHLMANTAVTGSTYEIDGGQQLVAV